MRRRKGRGGEDFVGYQQIKKSMARRESCLFVMYPCNAFRIE